MSALLEVAQERRTSPVELLWDLVFVFAVTQVTALLSSKLTWGGFGRSMLVLASGGTLADPGRLALCGGVALYLTGLVLIRRRLLGSAPVLKVVAALVLAAVGFFAAGLPAWGAALIVAIVLAVVSSGEVALR